MTAPPARFGADRFQEMSHKYGPMAVAINLEGQRFADESAGTGEETLNIAISRQPGATAAFVFDAATAERIGVVQSVVAREVLDETALATARDIRDNAPLAVQSIKRTINSFADHGLSDAMRFEAMSASVEFVSEDMPKGYAAKAAKQAPEFEGK